MNKYKNLIQNIGIFTLANFTTRILNFLILPLYTYYLTTKEYGTIDLVNSVIQLLYPIFTLSIVDAVLRFGISEKDKVKEIFSIGIEIIFIGFLVLCFGGFVSHFYIKDNVLIVCFLLIYLTQSINSLMGAVAKIINKIKELAIITTVTSVSILLFNVYLIAVQKQGIRGYWTATILGNAIGIILYVAVCRLHKYFVFTFAFKKIISLTRQMLKYSIPLIPNALFWWINSSLDRWTLTFFCGLSVVGQYSCANKIPTILSTVNTVFSQAWNISLFQNFDEHGRNSFYENIYYYFNEIIFCCSIGIIMLSKIIGQLMFSKDFFSAWIYIPLLTAGLYYNCLNSFIGSLFTASKKTKYIFTTTLAGSLANLFLNIPMVYMWGAIGAALATLISYIWVFIIRIRKASALFCIEHDKRRIAFQFAFILLETFFVMKDVLLPLVIGAVVLYCCCFGLRNFKKFINFPNK